MIVLYIVGAILLVIAGVLFLPVTVQLKFKDDFYLKIKFAGVRIFRIEPQKEEKNKSEKADTVSDKKAENETVKEAKRLFLRLKEKYGFSGAVKSVFGFFLRVLTHVRVFLKHVKINKLRLLLVIAGEDAAATAVEYGAVCSAVYPVLSMLEACVGIGLKNIDVRSNFTSNECEFGISLNVKLRVYFLLIAAYKIYVEYKKYIQDEFGTDLSQKENKDERK